jgi:TRAP-type C4-dicarboxylate transport system substrate-binding protein
MGALQRLLLATVLASSSAALAQPEFVIRIGSAVPEGTAWAREGHAFARDVENATVGKVRIRWILNGIAGDEMQMAERVNKGQLDGVGSGGPLCLKLAPSMRITRLVGLTRDRAETNYLLGRLKPTLDEEFDRAGYVNLLETLLGPELPFTREPVRTLDDLKRQRLWMWDLDEVFQTVLRSLGAHPVPLPLDGADTAYQGGRTDGFLAIPLAALAFQWSAHVRYLSDLPVGFLTGCLVVAHRSLDAMPVEVRKEVHAAAAKFQARLEEIGSQQDRMLIAGGLFAHQGLTRVPVSDELRRAFDDVAQKVRAAVEDRLVPAALRRRADEWIAQFRREAH